MNELLRWLSQLVSSWKFWIVVPPWDIGVRIRLGKVAVELPPGAHLRIPFVDDVILVNTRLRVSTTPQVTIATGSSRARVITATVGYRVADPLVTMMRFQMPDFAVLSVAQAEIASLKSAEECLRLLGDHFADAGIVVDFVRFTEDVEVRALRLLSGDWQLRSERYGMPDPEPGSHATY